MLTTGDILKKTRLEKNLTLEDVEKKTKIRKKFIEALEKGKLNSLPGKTYVQGFVKNYAEFLDLSSTSILAVLRREYDERQKSELIPKGLEKPLSGGISRKITIPATFIIALIIFGIYAYSQYKILGGTPDLTVDFPPDKYLVKSETVEIKGKTDPENQIFLNNQELFSDKNGNFVQKVTIVKGENKITVTVLSKARKEKKIERIVIGDLP